MLRRIFLKLSFALIVAPALRFEFKQDWDSMLLSEWRPWESPGYYIGQILTNRITGVKLVCVDVDKGTSLWRDLKTEYS